ncbi:hypothetical protein [Amycolatopsis keratiniphila]|uniref:Uncharacterized protein n=1 Tax=Amycolatopsis keratiniphila TaxID=129921 RepID=W6IBA8_9PSEU|nr:hypothetical protein [Amycolatopsis keratiniphila]AHJ58546.1 hypothetical protein AORI_P031 [Amycolatopsis keratiniphila]
MSAFDVLDRFGTAALLRFLGLVVLFVALHLVRIPLHLLARVLEIGMVRVNKQLATSVAHDAGDRPRRPHNDFFAPLRPTA